MNRRLVINHAAGPARKAAGQRAKAELASVPPGAFLGHSFPEEPNSADIPVLNHKDLAGRGSGMGEQLSQMAPGGTVYH
mgnify:CR=1 FL=1